MKRRLDFLVDERVVAALDRVRGRWFTTRTGAIIQMILREDEHAERGAKKSGKSGLGSVAGVRD
jgi:hypothetical protein